MGGVSPTTFPFMFQSQGVNAGDALDSTSDCWSSLVTHGFLRFPNAAPLQMNADVLVPVFDIELFRVVSDIFDVVSFF